MSNKDDPLMPLLLALIVLLFITFEGLLIFLIYNSVTGLIEGRPDHGCSSMANCPPDRIYDAEDVWKYVFSIVGYSTVLIGSIGIVVKVTGNRAANGNTD